MAARYYELVKTVARTNGWAESYTKLWVEDRALVRLGFNLDEEPDDFGPVLNEEIRLLRAMIAKVGMIHCQSRCGADLEHTSYPPRRGGKGSRSFDPQDLSKSING